MISHKYRVIFIHIPKTAGTSIEKQLGHFTEFRPGVQDHRTIYEIEKSLGKKYYFLMPWKKHSGLTRRQFQRYFKFTFVRNSWSRAYSWYKNVMYDELHQRNLGITLPCSFKRFLTDYGEQWALRSQLDWIINEQGEIVMDFVGRFERLQEDFNHVCDVIGLKDKELPWLVGGGGPHYTEAYDEETRAIVAERYKKEIEQFGFQFGE